MPEFAWPWLFALLPLPWLLRHALPPAAPTAELRLPHAGLDLRAIGRALPRGVRRWLPLLAWLLAVTAAARPQQVGAPLALPQSGRALLLALDTAGSMGIEDMDLAGQDVSRYAAVRAIAGDFVARRAGDEVGLILFGSRAYLVTPLTFDLDAVRGQLDDSAVGLAGRETVLGDAIAVATRRLLKQPAPARVLVLLTDGVNTAGTLDPRDAARIAAKAGVRIYTIGIGSAHAVLGDFFGGSMPGAASDLDEDTLRAVAAATGGRYFRAADAAQLADAYRAIDRLEPAARAQQALRPRRELFVWPLAAAVLMALAALPWGAARRHGACA
ncbi:MAG: VWA domain-containing protein [Mizugakiibacter sp.]|uniref:VWA domain-containing protein n=1 Tax=Mizugakiibacter sp. TaxID=1972610 RepID=UPI003210E11A